MNEFMSEQKKVEPDANGQIKYTFVKFSSNVSEPVVATLADVKDLTYEDYCPSGMTALYDAIGMTLDPIKEEEHVCVMIVTDGVENSSRKFKQKEVFDMIKDLEADKKWKFAYLSCDIDTWGQGNNLGFAQNAVVSQDSNGRLMCTGSTMNYCTPGVSGLGNHIASAYNNQCFAAMRTNSSVNVSGACIKTNSGSEVDNLTSGYNTVFHNTPGQGSIISS
jgi:hypothetical protein